MRIRKKQLFSLSIIVICLAVLASGTLAYFTAEEKSHNVITTGHIDIELVVKTRTDDGALIDFPQEGLSRVMPGTAVSKIVSVQNVGEHETWIRLRLEKHILSEAGQELPPVLEGGIQAMQFSLNSGKWIDGEDGYYYYLDPVPAGEATEIFFEEVRFAQEMGNAYQGSTANILVYAQAVQTANNGSTALTAAGWPTEVTE